MLTISRLKQWMVRFKGVATKYLASYLGWRRRRTLTRPMHVQCAAERSNLKAEQSHNAFIEAFNSRLRAECLNAHWFMALADAREKLEYWRRDDNEVRPHGAIWNKVLIALSNPAGETSPSVATEAENSNFE